MLDNILNYQAMLRNADQIKFMIKNKEHFANHSRLGFNMIQFEFLSI